MAQPKTPVSHTSEPSRPARSSSAPSRSVDAAAPSATSTDAKTPDPAARDSAASNDVERLLPPGGSSGSAHEETSVELLLPPACIPGQLPGRQVALPTTIPNAPLHVEEAADGSVLIPTDDGGKVAIRKPVKTIRDGDDEVELVELSREEKMQRRFKRNLVMWGAGALLLLICILILLWIGPMKS